MLQAATAASTAQYVGFSAMLFMLVRQGRLDLRDLGSMPSMAEVVPFAKVSALFKQLCGCFCKRVAVCPVPACWGNPSPHPGANQCCLLPKIACFQRNGVSTLSWTAVVHNATRALMLL